MKLLGFRALLYMRERYHYYLVFWKVDDLATAVLIKRFYRYLSEGDSRADALQKAQKSSDEGN